MNTAFSYSHKRRTQILALHLATAIQKSQVHTLQVYVNAIGDTVTTKLFKKEKMSSCSIQKKNNVGFQLHPSPLGMKARLPHLIQDFAALHHVQYS